MLKSHEIKVKTPQHALIFLSRLKNLCRDFVREDKRPANRVLASAAPFVTLHFRELDISRFSPDCGLSDGVPFCVTDGDRFILAAKRQQVLITPRSTCDLTSVLTKNRNLPAKAMHSPLWQILGKGRITTVTLIRFR